MKTTYLIFACIFTFVFATTAQTTPIPPNTNSFGNKHTSITTTISNSTSVSNSNGIYIFTSRFQRSKRVKIQKLLSENLRGYSLKKDNNTYRWSDKRNGSLVFECKLSNRTMKMFLHKNEVSRHTYRKIKDLGVELQQLITRHSSFSKSSYDEVSDARENLERATQELKRAKERLRRAKRKNN